MSPRSELAILGLLTVIWGTTWAAIRVGLLGVPPWTGAALRFALASAVLLLLARAWRVRLGTSRRERLLWLANGLFSFAISYGIIYWAEQYVPSAVAAVVFASFPLFVALLAHWFLPGERLTPRGSLGVVVGFGGVLVLFGEDLSAFGGAQSTLALALLPLSPLASAFGQIAVKRWGQGIPTLSITAVPMGLAATVFAVLGLTLESSRPFQWSAAAVGSILYLGLIGSALAFYLYFLLLARMPATQLALIAYMTPVVAVLVGVLALAEPLTWRLTIGGLTILAGVLLAARPPRASSRSGRIAA